MKTRTKKIIAASATASVALCSLVFITMQDGSPYGDLYCCTLYISDEYDNSIYCRNLVIGQSPDPTSLFVGDLVEKWNLISIPTDETFHKSQFMFSADDVFYSWDEAVNNSIVVPVFYGYDSSNQYYMFTDYVNGYSGYFFYVFVDCSMYILEEE